MTDDPCVSSPRVPVTLRHAVALGLLGLSVGFAGGCSDSQNPIASDGCSVGQANCNGACVDIFSDPAHCGNCGTSCGTNEICQSGTCSCPSGNCGPGSSGGAFGSGGQSNTGGVSPNGSGGIQSGSGGASGNSGGSGGNPPPACTNELPPDTDWPEATCDDWAAAGHCQDDWFVGSCLESCDMCQTTSSSGGSGGDGDGDGDGGNGDANPWGGVSGGQEGWASRYWDCCKQSCGWSNNAGGRPVRSCNSEGSSPVGPDDQSTCSGGQSTTCNSFTPWAYSSQVSFGFVATHVGAVNCGTCFHLEFTGQGQHNGGDPGSNAIAGKTMIVMATNIGGDVSGDGQMDLLLPGGGTGLQYGCNTAWGIQQGSSELGAQYGGLRADCGGGDLNSVKSCVAQKCQSVFGDRGLTDMYDGCMWYVDWLQAADNPKFRYEQIDCPQELQDAAY